MVVTLRPVSVHGREPVVVVVAAVLELEEAELAVGPGVVAAGPVATPARLDMEVLADAGMQLSTHTTQLTDRCASSNLFY